MHFIFVRILYRLGPLCNLGPPAWSCTWGLFFIVVGIKGKLCWELFPLSQQATDVPPHTLAIGKLSRINHEQINDFKWPPISAPVKWQASSTLWLEILIAWRFQCQMGGKDAVEIPESLELFIFSESWLPPRTYDLWFSSRFWFPYLYFQLYFFSL